MNTFKLLSEALNMSYYFTQLIIKHVFLQEEIALDILVIIGKKHFNTNFIYFEKLHCF